MPSLSDRLVDWLISRARRTPYTHLNHADGSPYMERYWLFQTRFLSARLHYICSPDLDRHMHDHPWDFISVVLRGSYIERRPLTLAWEAPVFDKDGIEPFCPTLRRPYSVALRFFSDRHLISHVFPNTWTLFISSPKRQSWGFYTPEGFVNWRDYPSCTATGQVELEKEVSQ